MEYFISEWKCSFSKMDFTFEKTFFMNKLFLACLFALLSPCLAKSNNPVIGIIDVVGHELLFVVNLQDDKTFNEYYTLQYQTSDFSFLKQFEHFELVGFTRGKLVVMADNTLLEFTTAGQQTTAGHSFHAYGLAKHSRFKEDQFYLNVIEQGNANNVVYKQKKKVTSTTGDILRCTSGGPGATQCSIGSTNPVTGVNCDVTCGNGYYACCDDAVTKCGCVANGMTPGSYSQAQISTVNYYFP